MRQAAGFYAKHNCLTDHQHKQIVFETTCNSPLDTRKMQKEHEVACKLLAT